MAIVQISQIQQRSGNLVDLPQLNEAEFGWATDTKQLFIGKTTPAENIEVLTSYSNIAFDQITGAVGNLNITASSLSTGEVLAFDGTNWVNAGGNAGGNINLGNVSNVSIGGGAIGYVLQTDGTGNLSWAPKTTLTAYIQDVTKANPAVVTTTQDNYFTKGAAVTITNVPGMTQLNGQVYYVVPVTSNTFNLCTTQDGNTSNLINSSSYTAFPYSAVSNTFAGNSGILLSNSVPFSTGESIQFIGTTFGGIQANTTYYILTNSANVITVSLTPGGSTVGLTTANGTANVYATGGRAISSIGGSGGNSAAAGSTTSIQYNNNNLLAGSASLTYDFANSILTVSNLSVSNPNTGSIFSNNFFATNNITANRISGNLTTNAQPNITSVGTLTSLNVSGNANVGNIGAGTGVFTAGITDVSGTGYALRVVNPGGASYATSTSAVSGAIKITLPQGYTNTMMHMTVTVYTYDGQAFEINLGGYNYLPSSGWYSTFADITTNSRPALNVRFGFDGTYCCIYIGETSTVWSYPQVFVTEFQAGYGNYAASQWNTGWSVSFATTLLNVTSTVNTASMVLYANGSGLTSLTGSNVTGTVAYATTANSVAGGNVSGAVGLATYATTANAVAGGNVSGAVGLATYATTANSVAGANVSGAVAYATTANSVAGGNVSGAVGLATYATTANAVAGANVSGTVANANNSSYLGGLSQTSAASASTVMARDTNGYAFAVYYNATGTFPTTGSAATSGMATFTGTNGSDNYGRGYTAAAAAALLSGQSMNIVGSASTVTTAAQPNITSVGTLSSLAVTNGITGASLSVGSGAVTLGTLTTGANTTSGTVTGNWTLSAGSRWNATYADLAENYVSDVNYEPGTVLVFGGEYEVTMANEFDSTRVAGVVSTNPAYIMNAGCEGDNVVTVALTGRVPVKVQGNVSKGDLMVTGANGYAVANNLARAGTIIGKALENFNGVTGIIEVVVGRV